MKKCISFEPCTVRTMVDNSHQDKRGLILRIPNNIDYRPFRLTRAIAHISTCANLSARAICRTHEKSYSAEKVLFIEYCSFNPSFMFTSAIFE